MSELNDLNALMTLVFHTVQYPDPGMPNKPETFGIPATQSQIKKLMTLGRMKVFPDEAMKAIFPKKEDNPLYRLRVIRSQLQSFVTSYTYPFMNGIGRALPDAVLGKFIGIVEKLNVDFQEAKALYWTHLASMTDEAVKFWLSKSDLYKVTKAEMEAAIRFVVNQTVLEDRFVFQVNNFEIKKPSEIEIDGAAIDAHEHLAVIEARNKVAQQAGKDLQQAVAQFQDQVIKDLREQFAQALEELVGAVNKGQYNQKSFNALMRELDRLKTLNVMDDTALEELIAETKIKLDGAKAKKLKKDEDYRSLMFAGVNALIKNARDIIDIPMKKQKQQKPKDVFLPGRQIELDPF